MQDKLAIANKVIEEHQSIRKYVNLVGDSIPDQEALTALERASAEWIPGRPGILFEKHKKLQRTINALEEGLMNHFAFERKVLPPLFGELIMHALIIEHNEIRKEVNNAKLKITNTNLEGLSREELLSKEWDIKRMIDNISLLIEEHAAREETILDMMRRALEEKG